jgi:hypothetical protein
MTQKNKIFSTIGNLLRYSYHATFFSISVIFTSLFYYFTLCRHFRMKMQQLGRKEKGKSGRVKRKKWLEVCEEAPLRDVPRFRHFWACSSRLEVMSQRQ